MRESKQESITESSADQRGGERRKSDRRRADRRAPPPMWRRPWAFVAYGVAGAVAAGFLFDVFGGASERGTPEAQTSGVETGVAEAAGTSDSVPTPVAPVQDAGTLADYERLIAEGAAARGRLVRVVLYCSAINSMELRSEIEPEPILDALADTERTVPAAECRWGEGGEVRPEDFVLVVPPELAEDFATAPVVQDGFVDRRRVASVVEWVGRSDALAVRTVGVLREIEE